MCKSFMIHITFLTFFYEHFVNLVEPIIKIISEKLFEETDFDFGIKVFS